MTGEPSNDWRQQIWRRTNLLVVTATFFVGLTGYLGFLTGDYLYLNGIPPWDASVYTYLARDFYAAVPQFGLYHIQRILPSAIIYHVFRLFLIQPTDPNVIHAFIILDALLITFTGYLFCLVADRLGISSRGKWLGFIGLFLNFAVLKHRLYDPILTDTTAYALGMLMFYFYLRKSMPGLIISTVFGAFTWPTMLIQGTLLLIFFERKAEGDHSPHRPAYLKKAAIAVSLLLSLGGCLFIIYARSISFRTTLAAYISGFYFSLAIVGLYLFFGIKTFLATGDLLNINYMWSYLANRRTAFRIVLVAVLIVLIKTSQQLIGSAQASSYPMKQYLLVTFWVSILYPGVFFISHVVYFGPILILFIFLWPEVCQLIHRGGTGLSLCALFCIALSLNSESRGMINFLPMFVVFLAKATDALRWSKGQYWLLAILSILMSKVWLTIGPMKYQGLGIKQILLLNQRLFMNNGPAMSAQMYLLQTCVVLVIGLIIYFFCMRKRFSEKVSPRLS